MIGPSVRLELSCFNCQHCGSRGYTCQGDSGTEVFCRAMDDKQIGDTTWETPDWCPFRDRAIREEIGHLFK